MPRSNYATVAELQRLVSNGASFRVGGRRVYEQGRDSRWVVYPIYVVTHERGPRGTLHWRRRKLFTGKRGRDYLIRQGEIEKE